MSNNSSLRKTLTHSDRHTDRTVDQVIKENVLLAYNNFKDRKFKDVHTILDAVLLTNKLDVSDSRQLDMLKRLIGDTIQVELRDEFMKEGFTQYFDRFVEDHLKWRSKQRDLVVDDLKSKFQDISSLVPMLESLHDRINTLEARMRSY
jgi:hypothetical protein